MKTKTSLLLCFILSGLSAQSQRPIMELTFTAVNNSAWAQLDSIKIMNRTQAGDTVLYWPDTVLSFNYVGLPEIPDEKNAFKVLQNFPNPVNEQTTVWIYVPEMDKVSIMVTDILGRMIVQSERDLVKGKHAFRFTPGNGNLYFFSAAWRGQSSSIKILNTGLDKSGEGSIEYSGRVDFSRQLKTMRDIRDFSFNPGDELLYIGYSDTLQSGIPDSPEESETYTLQFATNIPCPGTPTVDYDGQLYNTIQIFSQCWLKENLNVGEMIDVVLNQTDNGIIEKYCYNNEPDSCIKYGGLYQWLEMMQYTTQQSARGICPPGWHLPTEEEWKVLEGAVDSQYGIGDSCWDDYGYRGYDAGTNLKTTSGWYMTGEGTDFFGFSGLPGGYSNDGYFYFILNNGFWWTSTNSDFDYVWQRGLFFFIYGVDRHKYPNDYAFNVRCLRDE